MTTSRRSDLIANGYTLTDTCPVWCDGHDDEDREITARTGLVEHATGMAGGFLSELRTRNGEHVALNESVTWNLALHLTEHDTWSEDTTVDVEIAQGRQMLTLRPSPSEAVEISCALQYAADAALGVHDSKWLKRLAKAEAATK